MSRSPCLLASGLVCSLLTMLLAVTALAQEQRPDPKAEPAANDDRREDDADDIGWMPSLAFHTGAYTQSIDGSTTSSESTFSPGTGDSFLSTTIGFELKLHTAIRADIVGKPRLFFSGGFHRPLAKGLIAERIGNSFNRTLEGQPNPAFDANCPDTIPEIGGGLTQAETCTLTVRNRVSVDATWFVGIGVDITLPVFEDQLHILPSVSYYGLSAQSVGEFERTTRAGLNADDFVEIADAVGDPEIYHGISPAITFLADVYEDGPYRWSMFVEGRWVFYLDDPELASAATLGTNQIGFTSTMDDNAPQITAGVQVMFTGLGGGRR